MSGFVEQAGVELVAAAAGLGALGWLASKLYRAFKLGELAFVELVGTADQASLRQTIGEVKAVALRSEKELHPNGGGSLRDEVRKVATQTDRAVDLAADAATRAALIARQLETVNQQASDERADLVQAMKKMRVEITDEMARRTADAFELLAEHGGPDLRTHGAPVLAHTHEVPMAATPMTSGPVLQEDE